MSNSAIAADFIRALEPESKKKERAQKHKERWEAIMKQAVDFDPNMKWQETMSFKAESFNAWMGTQGLLFPDVQLSRAYDEQAFRALRADQKRVSPDGKFLYTHNSLPRGSILALPYGARHGRCVFDGPVMVPALYELPVTDRDHGPWMSFTPQEIFTLRAGTRLGKGHVVITGLGMGYQLMAVARRKQVTRITLVEISKELIRWLKPRISQLLTVPEFAKIRWIFGDAKKVLPKLKADIALLDHFKSYGGNNWDSRELVDKSPGIKRWWTWGGQDMRDEPYAWLFE